MDSTRMEKVYDLAVAIRRYTDRNGNEKAIWENVGTMFEKDGKPFIMLKACFNPAGIPRKDGSESILVSMFKPKNKSDSSDSFDSLGQFSQYQDTSLESPSSNTTPF